MEKQQEDLRTPHGQKLEVYVLAGASNAGKTTTLNHLAWLVANSKPHPSNLGGTVPQAFGANGNQQDAQYCFSVQIGGKTIVVGISTKGDRGKEIKDGFTFFDSYNCDICFIASKTSGSSVKEVEKQAQKRGIVPKYCYLINEHCQRNQTAVEQNTAEFLHSFVK